MTGPGSSQLNAGISTAEVGAVLVVHVKEAQSETDCQPTHLLIPVWPELTETRHEIEKDGRP